MSNEELPSRPSAERLNELAQIANRAIDEFRGNANELQSALGMLFIGQRYGWRVLLLVHDRKTVKKYERILGISIREEFPPAGDRARKSAAYVAVEKVSNFWKAVRGEIKGVRTPELE